MAATARSGPSAPVALEGRGRSELLSASELAALYEAHSAALRQAILRLTLGQADADDLLHDVFMVALRRTKQLRAAPHPKAWLYGVAVKLSAAARRRARLRQFVGLDTHAPQLTQQDTQLLRAEQVQARALVLSTLQKLSEKRRTVFVLYELEGLTGEEIAAALRIPLKTVWTRLFHARIDFQRHLGDRLAADVQAYAGGKR